MEGLGGNFSYKDKTYPVRKGTGVYLEPGEKTSVTAGSAKLLVLDLNVEKYTGKPTAGASGYFFENDKVQALIDARSVRIRTLLVN